MITTLIIAKTIWSIVSIESQAADSATTGSPSTFSNIAGGVASGAASGALGQVMGLIFGGLQDNRQYNQQARLQGLQLQGAQQAANISQQEQENLWNDTNYEAQVQHANNAGLNPALLYAKGGMGGSTGSGAVPMPTGAQAPAAGEQTQANQGMALMLGQQKLMSAQADLAEAQAQKISQVDVPNVKADTTLKGIQGDSLTQGIENQKAQEALTEINTRIQQLSGMDQIHTFMENALKAEADAKSAMANANVDQATQATKIDLIKQSLAQAYLNALQTKAGTDLTKQQAIQAQFEAGISQLGIPKDTPWYLKMIGNIASRIKD